jgi:hypothetical protein
MNARAVNKHLLSNVADGTYNKRRSNLKYDKLKIPAITF